MNNIDLVSYIPYTVVIGIALIVLLVILGKILVNVGAREIAIKERRYVGSKMPPGRVVATEGGIGTLLLLSLFKERLGIDGPAPAANGAPGNGSKVVAK